MAQVAAFVMAGGRSSRMGHDKAFLQFDGRTLLERALEVAHSVSEEVKIVGPRAKFAAYGPVVEDLYPGQGPLAGIHAALRASASELNLVIAVDTPFLEARLLRYLLAQAEASGALVTVPVTSCKVRVASCEQSETARCSDKQAAARHPATRNSELETRNSFQAQPLCAVYRREFAVVAEEALRQGRNNIVPLFAKVTRREIGDSELRQLAFDPRMFDNLNTPEEWNAACRRVRK